jgi:integrase
MVAKGRAPATIRQAIIPLKAICRREVHHGRLAVNPTLGLELPAVRSREQRFADPVEAAAPELRELLVAEIVRTGRRGDELLFGRTARLPFDYRRLTDRADEAWKGAKLNRIELHQCRHSFAALMIAASVNAKALCDYMGHSSIQVTFDKYGHLMPGNEDEAAELLHGYLEQSRAVSE